MNGPPGAPPPHAPPPHGPPPGGAPYGGAPPHGAPYGAPGPHAGPPRPAAPADPAKTAAYMLLGAAVLILIGVFSKSWVTGGKGSREIALGLMGAEMCRNGMCVPIPSETLKLPTDVDLVRMIGLIAGIAAAGAAAAFGGLSLANKKDKLPPIKLANIAFGLASFGMTFFVIRMMIEGKGVSISWAPVPAIGGIVLAGIGLKKLTPFLPPRAAAPQQGYAMGQPPMGQPPMGQPPMGQPPMGQPPMGQPPMGQQPMSPPPSAPPAQAAPQGQAQACPRCGAPLQFIAQYQRWFCPSEQQYV